jgi:glucose/arabinose dehydrogenase
MLYVTTGDAGSSGSAQSINTLSGKILRMTDSGGVPNDNPYSNLVYSYGHRNPQGLAWDANGNLWATEHGPSGVNTGYDEVNFIMKGANYGWPTITGNQTKSGMVAPVIQSGSTDTWAPAGMVIVGDKLFFTGLRGESLYSARITDNKLINFTKNFTGEFGRLRALVLDPSKKWLYVSTSNRDGRGKVNENDDKIIKIKLELFQ